MCAQIVTFMYTSKMFLVMISDILQLEWVEHKLIFIVIF